MAQPDRPHNEESNVERLQKALYERKESAELLERQKNIAAFGRREISTPTTAQIPASPASFVDVMAKRGKRRRRIFITAGVGAAVVVMLGLAIAATMWYRASLEIKPAQITVTADAPLTFTSGEEITYTVHYKNDSRMAWRSVEVSFQPPTGFAMGTSSLQLKEDGDSFLATIGDLASGQAGQLTITGQLLGQEQSAHQATFQITLAPANFPNERLTKAAVASTTITGVPVELSVEMADNAAPGDRVLGTIHLRNVGSRALHNMYLKISAPPGVELAKEDEDFSSDFSVPDSSWSLENLEPLAEATRTVVLYIQGDPGERRELMLAAGVREGDKTIIQREVAHVVTVTAPQLLITQTYNKSSEAQNVVAGQSIDANVHYKNVGTVGLKDVIITIKFEGAGLDASSLKLPQGSYNPTNKTITWSAASVPGLATLLPQQEGDLPFQLSILPLEKLPAGSEATNLVLVSTATIDSPNLPTPVGQERKVVSDRLVLSLTTNLTLAADAFYDDGRLGITSTGPLPPQVGEQTTYTVRLRVGSSINDAREVRVHAVLPDGVAYTTQNYKTNGTIDFNSRTGEVTWNIPLLKGLTGRAAPAEELDIQVAITPGEDKRGQEILLVKSIGAEAIDNFTEQAVAAKITQQMPTTGSAAKDKGKVE